VNRVLVSVVAVIGLAGLAGGAWWLQRPGEPPGWQGYVDADYVTIGPTQSGQLTALHVQRGDTVTKGARLFDQDDIDDEAARDQAAASLAQAKATLVNLQNASRETEIAQAEANLADLRAARDRVAEDLTRNMRLMHAGATPQQTVAQGQQDLASAAAKVRGAEAKLEQDRSPSGREYEIAAQQAVVREQQASLTAAQWRLDQRHVVAPAGGRIADTMAEPGEMLNAGTPVVSLLPPENIFVRFFVPEADLARIRIGQNVAVGCDSCGKELVAQVSFIAPQPEYTPPVIFSEDTRSKLVWLIEARPMRSEAVVLSPGQPVTVRPTP
jgi:HlyD family secretion protein